MARRHTDVWAGAKPAKGYTIQHCPLLWENMLGTVYAKREKEEAVYFDYDWEGAHAHIQLDKWTDLRVCRVKYSYQGWPPAGKWCLFGVPVRTQAELRAELESAEQLVGIGLTTSAWARKKLRALQALQLKEFNRN